MPRSPPQKNQFSVEDENGQTDKDTISITVNAPKNEAPKAVATASTPKGDAPLKIDFTGGNLSDDKGAVDYFWDFRDGSFSDQADTSHTFNDPGVYNVSLTVTDEEGLKDTAALSITVSEGGVRALRLRGRYPVALVVERPVRPVRKFGAGTI